MKKNIFFLLTLFMGLLATHMPSTASWIFPWCCGNIRAVDEGVKTPVRPGGSAADSLSRALSVAPSPQANPLEQQARPQPRIFYQLSSEESQAPAQWPATVRRPHPQSLRTQLKEHLSLSESPQENDLGPSIANGWTLVQLPPAGNPNLAQESGLKRTQAGRNLHLLLHGAGADFEGKDDGRNVRRPVTTSYWQVEETIEELKRRTLEDGFTFDKIHCNLSARTRQNNVRIPRTGIIKLQLPEKNDPESHWRQS